MTNTNIYEIVVSKENALKPMEEKTAEVFMRVFTTGMDSFRIIVTDGAEDEKVLEVYKSVEEQAKEIPWVEISFNEVDGDIWFDVTVDKEMIKNSCLNTYRAVA